jgi:hypothetical protein
MTEFLLAGMSAFLGWGASVEYRLGQLMKMKDDVSKTSERVDSLYEHLIGPLPNAGNRPDEAESGPNQG